MALVRQAVLIGSSGPPMRTHLTESVQMRVYRAIHFDLGETGAHSQDFFEFRLSREVLFSGHAGGLRAVASGEKEFPFFMSDGIDMFERENETPESWEGVVLLSCSASTKLLVCIRSSVILASGSARELVCHPSWSSGTRHVRVPSRFGGSNATTISLLQISKLGGGFRNQGCLRRDGSDKNHIAITAVETRRPSSLQAPRRQQQRCAEARWG